MNVSIFALLWQLRKKDLPEGSLFLLYVVLYAGGRFLITFWSAYRTIAFGLNQAQISIVALAVGLPLLVSICNGVTQLDPGLNRAVPSLAVKLSIY